MWPDNHLPQIISHAIEENNGDRLVGLFGFSFGYELLNHPVGGSDLVGHSLRKLRFEKPPEHKIEVLEEFLHFCDGSIDFRFDFLPTLLEAGRAFRCAGNFILPAFEFLRDKIARRWKPCSLNAEVKSLIFNCDECRARSRSQVVRIKSINLVTFSKPRTKARYELLQVANARRSLFASRPFLCRQHDELPQFPRPAVSIRKSLFFFRCIKPQRGFHCFEKSGANSGIK